MRRIAAATLAVSVSLTGVGRGQDPCRLYVEGALHGVHVLGAADFVASGRSITADLPAGAWRLRFPPGSGGRPAPVDVDAAPGGSVAVRVAAPTADAWSLDLAADLDGARTFDPSGHSDVRVRARVRGDAAGPTGLVCRWLDADNHYRLLLDTTRAELRLERCVGGSTLVLQRTELRRGSERSGADRLAARSADDPLAWHDLELEVEGFRLLALCDDEPVAAVLDGALSSGAVGTWACPGSAPRFEAVVAAAPAAALATVAVATVGREAVVTAAVPAAGNGVYTLCLRLDRPTGLWPTAAGFELFVLQRPAEPVFAPFACGIAGSDGALAGLLSWPDAAALRGQAAMVGGLFGSPDAQELRGRLPWATLRL